MGYSKVPSLPGAKRGAAQRIKIEMIAGGNHTEIYVAIRKKANSKEKRIPTGVNALGMTWRGEWFPS